MTINSILVKKKKAELGLFSPMVAKELGLKTVRDLTLLEGGKEEPTEEQIKKMCEIYQLSREELLHKEGSKTKVITVFNNKGGVGKTVTSVNLSAAFSLKGKKVLVIDFDGQANATKTFGIDLNEEKNIYTFLNPHTDYYGDYEKCIIPTAIKNIDIISGTGASDKIETLIGNFKYPERKFNEFITPIIELNKYDYIIIDNSSGRSKTLGLTLYCSDYALTPITIDEQYAIDGLQGVFEAIDEVYDEDSRFKNLMIFKSIYDKRKQSLIDKFEGVVQEHFGDYLLKTIVRVDINVGKSHIERNPLNILYPKSKAALDYIDLANEIESIISMEE